MSDDQATPARRRRDVTIAGHSGDVERALAGVDDSDANVRSAALGALERLGALTDIMLSTALGDDAVSVRRRAAEVAATHPEVDMLATLHDEDPRVVEVAAWTCGEHESNRDPIVNRLLTLATEADEALVRESAVAALGAIGDPRAIDAIIEATSDKPAVRRRAVLALAPFIDDTSNGARVDAAIERSLTDRDWQVRQAAEDLRRITGS